MKPYLKNELKEAWVVILIFSINIYFGNFTHANAFDNTDRILSFHSDVVLDKTGKVTVTETIKVYNGDGTGGSTNDLIQRGIIRSFPTIYKNKNGLNSKVGFRVLDTQRDNEYESYHIKKGGNGVHVYFGLSHIYLEKGIYEYKLKYETDRQMIFHKAKDEFYWNVTGNGWDFTIDEVTCTVKFPDGAKIFEFDCYTGFFGETNKECQGKITGDNTISFKATKSMQVFEGVTIAAAVQKGIFDYPSTLESFIMIIRDNIIVPIILFIFLLITAINYLLWIKHGKDPAKGIIYPRFTPPEDMSPADVGYALTQKFSNKLFVASIIDHAVRKFVNIDVREEGKIFKSAVYKFLKPKLIKSDFRDDKMYEWYGYDIERLYGIDIKKGEYSSLMNSLNSSLNSQLKERIEKKKENRSSLNIFKNNDGFVAIGVFLLIIMVVISIIYLSNYPNKTLIIFCVATFILSLAVHIFFSSIMNAYTVEGRKIVDQILGFKMYLETAEEKFFDELNPPEMSIQLYEKYLPYAIAMGCENRWAQKCDKVIQSALDNGYSPTYYSSSSGKYSSSDFSKGITSGLSGAISSASTPPSSSGGGSSGGGSSGGGGGGGGGSGW